MPPTCGLTCKVLGKLSTIFGKQFVSMDIPKKELPYYYLGIMWCGMVKVFLKSGNMFLKMND